MKCHLSLLFAFKQKVNSRPSQSVGTGIYLKPYYKYRVEKTKLSWREPSQKAEVNVSFLAFSGVRHDVFCTTGVGIIISVFKD